MIRIKRVYEEPSLDDGVRVLVDRLWPRGVSRQRAAIDLWSKESAPSPELRTWFDHRTEKFAEFRIRYLEELSRNQEVEHLKQLELDNTVLTLIYGAKNPEVNHALVLKEYLDLS
ncbi:MAG: DUF488 family protein [Candidatus Saccharimonadales bacterium]